MNNSINFPILQDSSDLSSEKQNSFSASELFEPLETWQKCYDAIIYNSLSDPIKDWDRNRQATLLFDFIHFLRSARPLLEKTLGQDWLNVPFLKWGIQYTAKDGRVVKSALNETSHTTDAWQAGRGMSALQIIKGLLTADNWQAYFGKKKATYYIAAFPVKFLVVDVDHHDVNQYDPRQDFVDWLTSNNIPCLLEKSKKGLHAYFANNGDYKRYIPDGLTQITLKNGDLLKVEILACSWNEDENKYDGSRSCFLGCERVQQYATPENCRLLNYDEGKDIDFRLPTALRVLEDKGARKNQSLKVKNASDKQKAFLKLASEVGIFTNETFSSGRHKRIFQLCRAYQFLYPDWREQDVIEAVVEYNRERHNPAYSDEEAIRLAKDAYKAIWQTEQAKKDLDEALHKKCKEPLEAVKWALSSLGLTVQLNDMNQRILINEGKDDRDLNSLSTQVYNELRTQLSHDNVRKNLCLLAKQQTIHPVLQYLQNLPSSDDDSELLKLYELMQIEDESKWYERAVMKKWLMQAVCMLRNSTTKDWDADIVLVLKGKQRCGKTSLCRKLAVKGNFFSDGISLDPDNVDSVRIATSTWITELGELASTTTRRDLHALKAFFTHRADTYRIPFAEWYEEIPRKTVFVGTVNDERFLKDDTGNSRYHVIEVPYMPYDRIQAIDTDRLWAYIYTLVEAEHNNGKEYSEIFRLSQEEREYAEAHVEKYNCQSPVEAELLDIMLLNPDPDSLVIKDGVPVEKYLNWRTANEIANQLPFSQKPNPHMLGRALKKLKLPTKIASGITKYGFYLSCDKAAELNVKNNNSTFFGILLKDEL